MLYARLVVRRGTFAQIGRAPTGTRTRACFPAGPAAPPFRQGSPEPQFVDYRSPKSSLRPPTHQLSVCVCAWGHTQKTHISGTAKIRRNNKSEASILDTWSHQCCITSMSKLRFSTSVRLLIWLRSIVASVSSIAVNTDKRINSFSFSSAWQESQQRSIKGYENR